MTDNDKPRITKNYYVDPNAQITTIAQLVELAQLLASFGISRGTLDIPVAQAVLDELRPSGSRTAPASPDDNLRAAMLSTLEHLRDEDARKEAKRDEEQALRDEVMDEVRKGLGIPPKG